MTSIFASFYDAFIVYGLLTLILILQLKATQKMWMSGQNRKMRMPWFSKRPSLRH